MFTLRYSQIGSHLKWDDATFTDCRPCEADGMQDDIIELAEDLSLGPAVLNNLSKLNIKQRRSLPQCLMNPSVTDWPLGKANEEARRICESALDRAREGYRDLRHAKTVYDEYEDEGRSVEEYPAMQLDKPTKEKVYEVGADGVYRRRGSKTVDAIGWGDEEVSDTNRTENADGTTSFTVRSIYFADPYGIECFNVVELIIKVEVVPSETVA
mmetsp:Transcript_39786/g.95751  ORF Transcript_39786/g.95751 Transcript_39786/m.95751 type:complete len:212 (+) Transcript_39786:84-719(+)